MITTHHTLEHGRAANTATRGPQRQWWSHVVYERLALDEPLSASQCPVSPWTHQVWPGIHWPSGACGECRCQAGPVSRQLKGFYSVTPLWTDDRRSSFFCHQNPFFGFWQHKPSIWVLILSWPIAMLWRIWGRRWGSKISDYVWQNHCLTAVKLFSITTMLGTCWT